MTDNNETSCLTVPRINTITLVTEVHIVAPFQMTWNPETFVVVEIHMKGMECSSIIFYNVRESSSDCEMEKTDGVFGQLLTSVPHNKGNICHYKLPFECKAGDGLCEFRGALVVNNMEADSVEICEFKQG